MIRTFFLSWMVVVLFLFPQMQPLWFHVKMRVEVVLTTLKANVGNNEIALPVIIHSSKNLPK